MRTKKSQLPPIPALLADVALIDGPSFASASGCSISQLHDLVRRGEAPAPVIKLPRFTRWRLLDAKTWLIERAAQPRGNVAELVTARAKKASAEARKPEAVAKARATRAAKKCAATVAPGQ